MKNLAYNTVIVLSFLFLWQLTSFAQESIEVNIVNIDSIEDELIVLGKGIDTQKSFIIILDKCELDQRDLEKLSKNQVFIFKGTELKINFIMFTPNNLVTYRDKICFERGTDARIFHAEKFSK